MGDGCQLECTKKYTQKVHEFIGPVKIVLVDEPPEQACRKEWGAAFVGIAWVSLGWTCLSVIFYTFSLQQKQAINAHIFLGTVGLLIPLGILNFSRLNGASIVLKMSHRKLEHMIIQFLGLLCGTAAAIVMTYLADYEFEDLITAHGVAGSISIIAGIVCVVGGLSIYNCNRSKTFTRYIRNSHSFCGVFCFSMSSLCFILGILKPSMIFFFEPVPAMVYFFAGFCVFYTIVIIYTPISKMNSST